MAAIPSSPQENGGAGDKLLFLTYDSAGSLLAALFRAYQVATIDAQVLGDMGVYPTSGKPKTGYRATTAGTELAISSSSVPCQGVLVKASPDNTEDIWVGATGITTNKSSTDGYRLMAGESVGVACRDVNTVFMRRGGSVDQAVYWAASVD